MMKRERHGPCGCCGGDSRAIYVVPGDTTHRRYCAPRWNTLGAVPNADDPFSSEHYPQGRGWRRLNAGT